MHSTWLGQYSTESGGQTRNLCDRNCGRQGLVIEWLVNVVRKCVDVVSVSCRLILGTGIFLVLDRKKEKYFFVFVR